MAHIHVKDQTVASLNIIRVRSRDCRDESIKLFSNVGESVRLPRLTTEDFWWDRDGLTVIKNTSDQDCTLELEIYRCHGDYVVLRSSHQSARTLPQGAKVTRLLKGGESLTLRSNAAQGKGAVNL